MEQTDGLGDDEARGGRPDERHGDRFTGEVAPAAFVTIEPCVTGMFARHALEMLGKLRLFLGVQVRP